MLQEEREALSPEIIDRVMKQERRDNKWINK